MPNEFLRLSSDLSAIGGVFGGLLALFWLGRKLVALDHAIKMLSDTTNRELSHNGGHSTKDYAERSYREVRKVRERVKLVEQKMNRHLDDHRIDMASRQPAPASQVVTIPAPEGATHD